MKLRKDKKIDALKVEKITDELKANLSDLERSQRALQVLAEFVEEKNRRKIVHAQKSIQELSMLLGEKNEREGNQ